MKDLILRRVYAGFAASCAIIGTAAVVAIHYVGQAEADADWVNHAHATIYELDRVASSLVTGDGAARTYFWTGNAPELATARGEFGEMRDHLELAKALTRDDPEATRQLMELDGIADRHAQAALALAGSAADQDRAAKEALLRSDPGGETLRAAKRLVARMRAKQFELLDQRDRAAYRQAQMTRWVVGICIGLDLVLLAAVAWLIRDDIGTRRKLAAALSTENERLEAQVRARTQELVASNSRLTAENRERQWAAQSLEHQLRYNQLIVDATGDLVFVVTRTLAVTRINPAVAAATGWTEEEILGRPLGDFVRVAGDGPAPLLAALRNGREFSPAGADLLDKNGHSLPVNFTLLPLRDQDKVVGGVAMVRRTNPA